MNGKFELMSLLSEKDRENIIRLLREGKPLPEMYKSTLFPSDDKEYIELTKVYQLVYQGKKRKEDVILTGELVHVLPADSASVLRNI